MIHVPPLPLYDGKSNYFAIACDVVVRGTFEMNFTCPKDVKNKRHQEHSVKFGMIVLMLELVSLVDMV
jgi:hypothetical protein